MASPLSRFPFPPVGYFAFDVAIGGDTGGGYTVPLFPSRCARCHSAEKRRLTWLHLDWYIWLKWQVHAKIATFILCSPSRWVLISNGKCRVGICIVFIEGWANPNAALSITSHRSTHCSAAVLYTRNQSANSLYLLISLVAFRNNIHRLL